MLNVHCFYGYMQQHYHQHHVYYAVANDNNAGDINNYIYLILQWLFKSKDLNTNKNDIFGFDYSNNNIYLTQWIIKCTTNMLYYGFVVDYCDEYEYKRHEHYKYDQLLYKYNEKELKYIGIVELIDVNYEDENEENDDEIMSFMCYNNIDKSPFHTQY